MIFRLFVPVLDTDQDFRDSRGVQGADADLSKDAYEVRESWSCFQENRLDTRMIGKEHHEREQEEDPSLDDGKKRADNTQAHEQHSKCKPEQRHCPLESRGGIDRGNFYRFGGRCGVRIHFPGALQKQPSTHRQLRRRSHGI